jgi:hypothetical protein
MATPTQREVAPMMPRNPLGSAIIPVPVLRLECQLICPTCLEGVGFLHAARIEPGQGIQVTCPKCQQRLGVRLVAVDLGRPSIISG